MFTCWVDALENPEVELERFAPSELLTDCTIGTSKQYVKTRKQEQTGELVQGAFSYRFHPMKDTCKVCHQLLNYCTSLAILETNKKITASNLRSRRCSIKVYMLLL
jgi:hypothetical protein